MIIKVVILLILSCTCLFASESANSDIGTLFWRIITFIVFVVIIYKLAKNPILEMLDRRKINIIKNFDSVEKENANLDKSLKIENDKLLHLDSELEELKKKYYKQLELEKEHIINEYEQELKKFKTSVERAIEGEQKKIVATSLDEILRKTIDNTVVALKNKYDKKQYTLHWKKNIGRLSKIEK